MVEDEVAAIITEWTSGADRQIRENPEGWLQRVFAAVLSSDDWQIAKSLAYPLKALLDVCGDTWVDPLVNAARGDRRLVATAFQVLDDYFGDALSSSAATERIYRLLGRDLMIETWIRYNADKASDWDFWPHEIFYALSGSDPEEARSLVLEIIERAPIGQAEGHGAGFLEDVIVGFDIEEIEAQAQRSEKFRKALLSVWIEGYADPEFVASVQRAAR